MVPGYYCSRKLKGLSFLCQKQADVPFSVCGFPATQNMYHAGKLFISLVPFAAPSSQHAGRLSQVSRGMTDQRRGDLADDLLCGGYTQFWVYGLEFQQFFVGVKHCL